MNLAAKRVLVVPAVSGRKKGVVNFWKIILGKMEHRTCYTNMSEFSKTLTRSMTIGHELIVSWLSAALKLLYSILYVDVALNRGIDVSFLLCVSKSSLLLLNPGGWETTAKAKRTCDKVSRRVFD